MEDNTTKDIIQAPAPWRCKAQVYALYFYHRRPSAASVNKTGLGLPMPSVAYSPLEADSYFSSPSAGDFVGGLGSIMVVRYTNTPVGPYDEMVVIPGKFEYDKRTDKTWQETGQRKCNVRLSRAYVSQKHTCYNGRLNWNIPKHIARFEWTELPNNGGTQVKVFPQDSSDASSSSTPLFQTSFKTVPYVPAFPVSTKWASYLGMDLSLVNPPLPQGRRAEDVGTSEWCKSRIEQSSSRTHVGWFDMRQDEDATASGTVVENFWPGLGRWRLGVRMDDAHLEVPEGEYWRTE